MQWKTQVFKCKITKCLNRNKTAKPKIRKEMLQKVNVERKERPNHDKVEVSLLRETSKSMAYTHPTMKSNITNVLDAKEDYEITK